MSTQETTNRFSQLITPVRSGNVFEETVEKIITYITAGMSLPGDKLPSERELCDLLGVSRATIHEVITEVQKLGYIEVKRGRYGGAYILSNAPQHHKKLSAEDAQEIANLMDYRAILESAASKRAALKSLSARERAHLVQALEDVEKAGEQEYRALDSRFHVAITHLAGIPQLTQQLVSIRAEVNRLLNQFPLLQNNIRHSDSQHRIIVDAILRGDPSKAESTAEEHVQGTASLIRALARK